MDECTTAFSRRPEKYTTLSFQAKTPKRRLVTMNVVVYQQDCLSWVFYPVLIYHADQYSLRKFETVDIFENFIKIPDEKKSVRRK